MYQKDTIISAIKLFNELTKDNIIGYKRENYIKKIFGCHINTVYNWIKKYGNFDFSNFNKSKYNNKKITDDIEKFILSSITKNNTFKIKEIKKNVKSKFNIELSRPSIYNVLHKNNLTFKQIKVKNVPYSDDKMKELKHEMAKKIEPIKNDLVSYDEMAVYLNDTPSRGWSIKGTDCIIQTKKPLRRQRFSIGMSIDYYSNIDFTLVEGSLRQDDLINFFNKLNKKKIKEKTFFMDNASTHKSKKMKLFIEKNKMKVTYNIPYCSDLNPIEYIFSLLRKKLLDEDVSDRNDIIKILIKFKKEINKQHVKNIFNKCINSMQK